MTQTIPHPETDEPIEVDFVYYPGYTGPRDEFGNKAEPDEPEQIAILAAYSDGQEIELTNQQKQSVEKTLLKQINNSVN